MTDANLALGRLDGENFLGGGMRLDVRRGTAADRASTWRGRSSLAFEPAAEGLLAVTNANLGAAIRLSLFEKGLDPRDFAMIAFGGAAGLHASRRRRRDSASAASCSRRMPARCRPTASCIPTWRTTSCAPRARRRPESLATLGRHGRQPARGRAGAARCRCGAGGRPQIELAADMRYKGQAFELTVPAPASQLDEAC